ncbi:hypothetical protein CLPUN_06940 [Clostridium puniceum]|uniref:Uncharacterized protein n=1 Tax=Clostridium puniceum TaxID=29367 RepID=A0A1S8TWG5_9CLOT|nr:hypothetical protein CLPUN_06940 [Clostridium puniceum]
MLFFFLIHKDRRIISYRSLLTSLLIKVSSNIYYICYQYIFIVFILRHYSTETLKVKLRLLIKSMLNSNLLNFFYNCISNSSSVKSSRHELFAFSDTFTNPALLYILIALSKSFVVFR